MNVIELEGLSRLFAPGVGVRSLSLSVRQGEVYGFIGPNGAGKTTTIRAMLGISRRTSGAARVLGVDLEREPARKRAVLAQVGYVASEPSVYEGMTVGAMLALLGALHGGETRARREELCRRLDLSLDRRADELSLGNKKKLALVAAMQHRPALLVLDEPSNGLDPLVQKTLFELVREEQSRGTTVFFSSHVLSEVERFCDRFALVRQGELVKVLSVSALRESERRRVRAKLSNDGHSALATLGGIEPDRGVIGFETERPLAALIDAAHADRDRLRDLTIDRPSLEELVLREYAPKEARS
jgi:ABC-2 type transport system ATP-binding protein